jgi:hypothetical protein
MAETVRRIEYYYVKVSDEPGTAARTLGPLKQSGVNLLAYLAFPIGDKQSQLDLVPEDPAAFKVAAGKAGIPLSEAKKAFLVQGDDRTGAVMDTVSKLAEAKINITATMATAAGAGRYGLVLWVSPADYEGAAKALGV